MTDKTAKEDMIALEKLYANACIDLPKQVAIGDISFETCRLELDDIIRKLNDVRSYLKLKRIDSKTGAGAMVLRQIMIKHRYTK